MAWRSSVNASSSPPTPGTNWGPRQTHGLHVRHAAERRTARKTRLELACPRTRRPGGQGGRGSKSRRPTQVWGQLQSLKPASECLSGYGSRSAPASMSRRSLLHGQRVGFPRKQILTELAPAVPEFSAIGNWHRAGARRPCGEPLYGCQMPMPQRIETAQDRQSPSRT